MFNQMGATWREAAPQVLRLVVVTLAYIALAGWMASRRASGAKRGIGVPAASLH